MRRILLVLAVCAPSWTCAESAFSGADAANLDWAVKSCGITSSEKEHGLVEAANARGREAFLKQYLARYETRKIKDAGVTTQAQATLCQTMKDWYGHNGSRIADLIKSVRAVSEPPRGAKPLAKPESGSRRGHQRSGH